MPERKIHGLTTAQLAKLRLAAAAPSEGYRFVQYENRVEGWVTLEERGYVRAGRDTVTITDLGRTFLRQVDRILAPEPDPEPSLWTPTSELNRARMFRSRRSERPAVVAAGSATSAAAAEAVEPRRGSQRANILEALRLAGGTGLTRTEIAQAVDLSENTVRPRVLELVDDGLVAETVREREGRRVLVALPPADRRCDAGGARE